MRNEKKAVFFITNTNNKKSTHEIDGFSLHIINYQIQNPIVHINNPLPKYTKIGNGLFLGSNLNIHMEKLVLFNFKTHSL